MGLINAVVPLDTLHEQAFSRAKKLAQGPTVAFGGMRAFCGTPGRIPCPSNSRTRPKVLHVLAIHAMRRTQSVRS